MKTSPTPAPAMTYFPILRRHSRKMLATFALVMGLVMGYCAVSPVLYTSEAKIFVRLGRETVALDPTATTGQIVNVLDTRENEINSIYELLKSRSLIEQLVDAFGTDAILGKSTGAATEFHPHEPAARAVESRVPTSIWTRLNPLTTYSVRDKAIRKLSQRLHVDTVRKSNIINVSCDATEPALAQQLVARAIELAQTTHMRVNRTVGSFDFFDAQWQQQAQRLAELEDRWRDLKNRTGIAAVEEQRAILQRRIATLEDKRLGISAGLDAARAAATARGQMLADLPIAQVTSQTIGQAHTAASRMREQLYALELKEQDMLSRFQKDSVIMQEMRDQIAAARAMWANEAEPVQTTTSLNLAHQQVQVVLMEGSARAVELEAESSAVERQLADARTAMSTFNDAELALVRLEREIKLETASFSKYAENRELARIDQALQEHSITNLNVLQAPSYSITPTKPQVLVNLVFGFVLASIASGGIAGLSELRSRPLPSAAYPLGRSPWDADDSEMPVRVTNGEPHHGNGNGDTWNGPSNQVLPR